MHFPQWELLGQNHCTQSIPNGQKVHISVPSWLFHQF